MNNSFRHVICSKSGASTKDINMLNKDVSFLVTARAEKIWNSTTPYTYNNLRSRLARGCFPKW